MDTPIDKGALQLKWLSDKMSGHPNWRATLPPARPMIMYQNKCLVVWKMAAGGPRIIDILKAHTAGISFTSGLGLTFHSGAVARSFAVNSHPREVLADVFMWIPPFSEVRFTPMSFDNRESTWRLTLPVMVRSSGGTDPQHGETAVSSLKEFRAQWPEIAV